MCADAHNSIQGTRETDLFVALCRRRKTWRKYVCVYVRASAKNEKRMQGANIQTITEKVKCYWPTSENASDIRFLKLKRDYYSVLNFTAEVDNLFGPPLLVFFIKSFISVVLKSFHIGEDLFFNHHIWYKYLPLIIAQLLMIAVIIIVSELMKSNVRISWCLLFCCVSIRYKWFCPTGFIVTPRIG